MIPRGAATATRRRAGLARRRAIVAQHSPTAPQRNAERDDIVRNAWILWCCTANAFSLARSVDWPNVFKVLQEKFDLKATGTDARRELARVSA
jgi:hypothetical protein